MHNRRRKDTGHEESCPVVVLHIKQEVDDVAVLHYVFLTFTANQALALGIGHGAAILHILEGNDRG